jgi:hypothetical protein
MIRNKLILQEIGQIIIMLDEKIGRLEDRLVSRIYYIATICIAALIPFLILGLTFFAQKDTPDLYVMKLIAKISYTTISLTLLFGIIIILMNGCHISKQIKQLKRARENFYGLWESRLGLQKDIFWKEQKKILENTDF